MMTNLFLGRDAFLDYSVSVTGITLIIPALFWLFFEARSCAAQQKAQSDIYQTTRILFWLVLLSLGVLIAPGSSLVIQKALGSEPIKNTMICIPTALVTVYTFIHLITRFRMNRKGRAGVALCLVILIITSSSIYMTYDHPLGIELPRSPMKISHETQEICNLVSSQYVLLPEELYGQIGEFDSGIQAGSLKDVTKDSIYADRVAAAAYNAQAPLVVIRKSYDDREQFEYMEYERTAETKHYVIYQRLE